LGWPQYLLEEKEIYYERKALILSHSASGTERQWKGMLSWMLGVSGARHYLQRDGYRWIAQ
jgi:hypothetical protein